MIADERWTLGDGTAVYAQREGGPAYLFRLPTRELADAVIRDHARATSPAVTKVEIVDHDTARALPHGSQVVRVDPYTDRAAPGGMVIQLGHNHHALTIGSSYRVIHRAPVPPLAVGDPVETVDQLDALPVGAVVRAGQTFRIGWRHVNGWSTSHGDDGRARTFLVESLAHRDRLRVLDLPASKEDA